MSDVEESRAAAVGKKQQPVASPVSAPSGADEGKAIHPLDELLEKKRKKKEQKKEKKEKQHKKERKREHTEAAAAAETVDLEPAAEVHSTRLMRSAHVLQEKEAEAKKEKKSKVTAVLT